VNDTSEEKTLPPSDKKLKEARKKGQVPQGREMVTAAVTVASFGYLMLRAPGLAVSFETGLKSLPDVYDLPFTTAVGTLAERLSVEAFAALLPLIGLIVIAVVVTNLVINGGPVLSLHPITPDAEHINPISGFGRMFSLRNLLELVKSILKLAVVIFLVFQLIEGALQALVEIPACGLSCGISALGALLKRLLLVMAGLFLVLGGLDIGIQKWLFMRDQRMTLTEQKRERKDTQGDPEIKKRHRRERQGGGPKTGLSNANFAIRSASVVLAMRYTTSDAPVPVLVARAVEDGVNPLLAELRSLGVPVVFDSAATDSISPGLKVGEAISKEMFQPVIECMRAAGVLSDQG
jgi:type III secretion protein U